MNISSLRHGAGVIRKVSRQSIKMRRNGRPSPAGSPPFTRPSRRNGNNPLKNSIIYEVEKDNEIARIGVGFKRLVDVGYAHEVGGWYKMRRWRKAKFFPKRPFMLPALIKVSPNLPKFWEGKLRK
jgi:hypothetical protein